MLTKYEKEVALHASEDITKALKILNGIDHNLYLSFELDMETCVLRNVSEMLATTRDSLYSKAQHPDTYGDQ